MTRQERELSARHVCHLLGERQCLELGIEPLVKPDT